MDDSVATIFREETREHLAAMEKAFLDLEAASQVEERRELINSLFRRAHSVKGDAKVVGMNALKQAAQKLEDVLDDLRNHPDHVVRDDVDRGLAQFDEVRKIFDSSQPIHRSDRDVDTLGRPGARSASNELSHSDQPAPAGAPSKTGFKADETLMVRVPSEQLDRMLNVTGEMRICQRSSSTLEVRLGDLRQHVTSLLRTFERHSASKNRQELETTLDQIRRIDGELRKKRAREDLLAEALEADIREARLLPLTMLTDSLRRAVRDLAQSLEKSIRFEADVGKIMLDKAVIEALRAPLLHLIRNAADHGIEAPDERQAAGKGSEGCIRVSASQQGALVHITISDDGRGVNFPRVRERVRDRGGLSEVEIATLADDQLLGYLFQPGFSTSTAGDVSGRGVGLDVVRDAVRRLQGNAEFRSTSSAGSSFGISVPVSISTIRIVTVQSGGQYFGIPTIAIRKTGSVREDELRELEGAAILPIDGKAVRWITLSQILGIQESPRSNNAQARSYVLVRQQNGEIAIAVDEIEDESEVLLKPMGFPLTELPGTVGATVRTDGSVQLVLDAVNTDWTKAATCATRPLSEPEAARRILVADDSPTTRAVLRNVFSSAGYLVTTAKDGIDALELLRSQAVDLVVTDVDMPRLNGLDLTRHIKSTFDLPVILVTGREKEAQRREGLAAGADAYLVKSSFEDLGLLELVRQFL